MSGVNELFTEKFRPKNLNQLIVVPRIKEELSKGLVHNLLLVSTPGTGKTSALFILSKGHPTLYMNTSEERGIDTIRNRIIEFCSSVSLDQGKEKLKCVILDEIDGATAEYFSALRGVIERYANTTRFITSCNYIQKIPDAIQSRFHKISFDPINSEEEEYLIKEYKERVKLILNAIKISYTDDILSKFVLNDFPDLRAIINKLQSLYLRGAKQLDLILDFDFEELFKLCLAKPDPVNNYKFISEQYSNKIDESLVSLGRDFIKYLKEKAPNKVDKIPLIIITMAEYQYQKQFVIDPIITLLAACMKIQQILNE